MNKQPFYHDAQPEGKLKVRQEVIYDAVKAIPNVLADTIDIFYGDYPQIIFTATEDMTAEAAEVLKGLGIKLLEGMVECEAGCPTDLM